MTGKSSVNSSGSKRNPIAIDLATTKYHARVIPSRKVYKRKGRIAQPERAAAF